MGAQRGLSALMRKWEVWKVATRGAPEEALAPMQGITEAKAWAWMMSASLARDRVLGREASAWIPHPRGFLEGNQLRYTWIPDISS
jgi:hypothetical protein